MNSTVRTRSRDGTRTVEIYPHRIDEFADEYIGQLVDAEEIYNPQVFLGLLKYIYVQMFKPHENMPHNSNSILVLSDAETIGDVWDRFAAICYRYRTTPTLLKFSTLTGLDRKTIQAWHDGDGRSASPEYLLIAKKMYNEAETGLETKALEQNGIGAIFALKSLFNWRETSPEPAPLQERRSPQLSQEELMQIIDERAKLDALPDLEDEGGEG